MLNTTDRVQGWADAPLTPAGEEVVEVAGRGMADIEFQSAYASSSGRAYQTAGAHSLSKARSPAISPSSMMIASASSTSAPTRAISTTQCGRTSRTTRASPWKSSWRTLIPRNLLDTSQAGQGPSESEGNWPAEDYDTIVTRLDAGLTDIVKTEAAKGDGNVLIVSHGLSIMALLKHLFGDDMPEASGVANASVTIIEYMDGKYELKSFNDESYIEKGPRSNPNFRPCRSEKPLWLNRWGRCQWGTGPTVVFGYYRRNFPPISQRNSLLHWPHMYERTHWVVKYLVVSEFSSRHVYT